MSPYPEPPRTHRTPSPSSYTAAPCIGATPALVCRGSINRPADPPRQLQVLRHCELHTAGRGGIRMRGTGEGCGRAIDAGA